MFVRLSYTINAATPTSADIVKPVAIHPIERIAQGDRSNLSRIEITNHYGSHIDSPNHFNPNGRRLVDFPIGDFVFESPFVIDVPKSDMGLVSAADLAPWDQQIARCDLLLLRTGFSQHRARDTERYRWKTPGVSAEAAQHIMDHFPGLRALGMDFISLEWTSDISHEFLAHRTLLGDTQHPMMLIEDISLDFGNRSPGRVYAFPLLFDDLDSFPATIVAEFENSDGC